MIKEKKIQWIISQHENTNHKYDKDLPYAFHLRMVVSIFKKFIDLVPYEQRDTTELICWGHDLIEDARVTYNDCAPHSLSSSSVSKTIWWYFQPVKNS